MKSHFKRIGIVMAMQSEADPVIEKFNLKPEELKNQRLPTKLFTGSVHDVQICLAVNGKDPRYNVDLIGSQPAVLTTHILTENFSPDLIISAGTAGGLCDRGTIIGDVFISSGPVCFHDRRYPIQGYREYGIGSYPSWDASSLDVLFANVSSGDSLYMSAKESRQFKVNQGDIKDMEAAAVSWVASLHEIPFMAVKTITDLIDRPTKVEKQFVLNFKKAIQALTDELWQLISQKLPKAATTSIINEAEYTISDATRMDVKEIIDWLKQEATEGSGFYHNRELIEKGQKYGKVRVIKEAMGGPVLGFLLRSFDSISIIEVKPSWRRRGLATSLIKEALMNFEEEMLLKVTVQCTPETSVPFWKKMSFQMLPRKEGCAQHAFYSFHKNPKASPSPQRLSKGVQRSA